MLSFALRSGAGLELWNVDTSEGVPKERHFKPVVKETKPARSMTFSENFFAVGNADGVKVSSTKTKLELKYTLPQKRAFSLKFSPKETYLVVYEMFNSKDEIPNMFIYETATGSEKISFVMKKHSEWEPFFSHDDAFFAIMSNGNVSFYENFVKVERKLSGKVGAFSVSPGTVPHVALYIPGVKGSPSMCRLFKYPNLDTSPVSSKSFSQADKVEMMWNKKGTGCLILTSMDVDSTGVSYYGKQALHFLATNGDSYSVPLSGEGPIHSVAWSPKSTQFIVVYGYMPAKATMFNLKCDSVFDFGTGVRNAIYFNDFGNMVLFGGFGNLRGQIEVWDLVKKKQISSCIAADTTLLEWAPTGEMFLTATTAPRLRQGNAFKIWHYSGSLLYEMIWPEKQELLELQWQKYPDGAFRENPISYNKIDGIQSVQKQASDKKYVPPNVRAFIEDPTSAVKPPAQGPIPGLPPGYTSSKVANAGKGKGQQQARKKPQNQGGGVQPPTSQGGAQTSPQGGNDKDDDDRKKASAIKRKLKDIKVLKEKLEKGEKLDKNQLNKISTEADLNKELAALKLS